MWKSWGDFEGIVQRGRNGDTRPTFPRALGSAGAGLSVSQVGASRKAAVVRTA